MTHRPSSRPHRQSVVLCLCVLIFVFSAVSLSPGGQAEGTVATVSEGESEGGQVYVLPVEGTIDAQMASFIRRGLLRAQSADAAGVVLRVRTLGGTVDAALTIRDALLEADMPTIAMVRGRAWSGGALVVLACEHVVMAPDSSLGAAEPRPAEEKIISAWRAEMESTADARGRDPQLAAAMVDARLEVSDLVEQGQLLTLTASQAERVGLADAVAADVEEAAAFAGIAAAEFVEIQPGGIDRFAGLATDPVWSSLLLVVGFWGLLIEMFIPGFGVAGMLGVLGFAGYFLAHVAVGHAGLSIVALFILGVALLVSEIFMPGFGVVGGGGMLAMMASIYLAAPNPQAALGSLLAALGALVIGAVVLLRLGHRAPMWRRLALSESETPDRGYVATENLRELEGQRGIVQSTLRPAGTAKFGARRVDVVSEGGFIPRDTEVEVIRVEGRRIVVREVSEDENQQNRG